MDDGFFQRPGAKGLEFFKLFKREEAFAEVGDIESWQAIGSRTGFGPVEVVGREAKLLVIGIWTVPS